MPSKFEQIKKSLSTAKRKALTRTLATWDSHSRIGQRITRNFDREEELPLKKFKTIVNNTLLDDRLPINTVQIKYKNECYNHVLNGSTIKFEPKTKPQYFGCAIEKGNFLPDLFKNKKIGHNFKSKKRRQNFIHMLKTKSTIEGTKKNGVKTMKLKEFSVWSTWDFEKLSPDPFRFTATDDAQEVRSAMGLPKIGTSRELLILSYSISTRIKIKKPTIADAGLHEYFEPPLKKSSAGKTVTWGTAPFHIKKGYNNISRPECIHESIMLNSIILPISSRR